MLFVPDIAEPIPRRHKPRIASHRYECVLVLRPPPPQAMMHKLRAIATANCKKSHLFWRTANSFHAPHSGAVYGRQRTAHGLRRRVAECVDYAAPTTEGRLTTRGVIHVLAEVRVEKIRNQRVTGMAM